MARGGSPRMGFSACFGAPLLSTAINQSLRDWITNNNNIFKLDTLLGLGISFAIVCSQLGVSVPVNFTNLSLLMSAFLVTSLVTVLVWLPLNRFMANKWLGSIQYVVYASFLIVAVLQEANVLMPDP